MIDTFDNAVFAQDSLKRAVEFPYAAVQDLEGEDAAGLLVRSKQISDWYANLPYTALLDWPVTEDPAVERHLLQLERWNLDVDSLGGDVLGERLSPAGRTVYTVDNDPAVLGGALLKQYICTEVALGQPFIDALREALRFGDVASLAKKLFVFLNVANPLVEVADSCYRIADKVVEASSERTISDQERHTLAMFLNETFFSAISNTPHNVWNAYVHHSRIILGLLESDEYKEQLADDLVRITKACVAQGKSVFYPAQMAYVLESIRLPDKSLREAVMMLYDRGGQLSEVFLKGGLSYLVTAVSRAYELPEKVIEYLKNKDATLYAPFGGLLGMNAELARYCGSRRAVVIDQLPVDRLKQLHHGGRGLVVGLETQRLEHNGSSLVKFLDVGVDVTYVQATIPKGLERGMLLDEGTKFIVDSKGSCLYLDPPDQLEYLQKIISVMKEGDVLGIDAGVPTGILARIHLVRTAHGLELLDYDLGMSTKERASQLLIYSYPVVDEVACKAVNRWLASFGKEPVDQDIVYSCVAAHAFPYPYDRFERSVATYPSFLTWPFLPGFILRMQAELGTNAANRALEELNALTTGDGDVDTSELSLVQYCEKGGYSCIFPNRKKDLDEMVRIIQSLLSLGPDLPLRIAAIVMGQEIHDYGFLNPTLVDAYTAEEIPNLVL